MRHATKTLQLSNSRYHSTCSCGWVDTADFDRPLLATQHANDHAVMELKRGNLVMTNTGIPVKK